MHEARGVYKAWWKVNGHEVLYAVDSNGNRLKGFVVELRPGVSEARAYAMLEERLDRVDPPRPSLKLITPPPRPKVLTVEQIDRLYRQADPVSALLWARKKERAAREGRKII